MVKMAALLLTVTVTRSQKIAPNATRSVLANRVKMLSSNLPVPMGRKTQAHPKPLAGNVKRSAKPRVNEVSSKMLEKSGNSDCLTVLVKNRKTSVYCEFLKRKNCSPSAVSPEKVRSHKGKLYRKYEYNPVKLSFLFYRCNQ